MKENISILSKGVSIEINGKQISLNNDKNLVELKKSSKVKISKDILNVTDSDDLIVVKDGENLEIFYSDGSSLTLEGFYALEDISLEFPVAENESHILSSSFEGTLSETSIIYAQGDMSKFSSLFEGNQELSVALDNYNHSLSGMNSGDQMATGTAVSEASTAGTIAGLSQTGMLVLGGVVVGGVAIASGGGGSGGGESAPVQEVASSDTTAPNLVSWSADSTTKTVTLTFNENMSNISSLDGVLAVNTGGILNPVSSYSVSGAVVTLTLTNSFVAGNAVTINYTPASTNDVNAIQDLAGNDVTINLSSGLVADGYVSGAKIYIKPTNTAGLTLNSDGLYDTGIVTDTEGNFFLLPSTPSGSIVAIGGVNIDTGVVIPF